MNVYIMVPTYYKNNYHVILLRTCLNFGLRFCFIPNTRDFCGSTKFTFVDFMTKELDLSKQSET